MIFKTYKICLTEEEHQQGLQHEIIEPDECCIFIYEQPKILRFWGKNTKQDLCVFTVDNSEVQEVKHIKHMDLTPVIFSKEASIGIEAIQGGHVGDSVHFISDIVKVNE